MVILGHFDIEITPLIAAYGLGGLAVALADKKSVSFFKGLRLSIIQGVIQGVVW
ncbi:MAG: hypothetical protein H0M93_00715 [Methanophagales archaeon]|nr:hypothetical protein [Methanophagales archaeon]